MEKSCWQDPISQSAIKLSILSLLTCFFFLLFFLPKLPPEVPLFYSGPWGEEQLAPKIFLFILPLFSLLAIILNLFLASLTSEKLLARTVFWIAALSSFLSAYTLIKIVFLIA